MRIEVYKLDNGKYNVLDIIEMETLTGEKVEVIKGKCEVDEDKVKEIIAENIKQVDDLTKLLSKQEIDKQINAYKENIDGNIEMIKDHNKRLLEIQSGINKLK